MAKKIFADPVVWDGSDVDVIDLNYDESYDEVDVTDTGTTGDGREFLGGRAARTFNFAAWIDHDQADLEMNSEKSLVLNYGGKTYSGQGILLSKAIAGVMNEAVKYTYNGRFNGAVTVTPGA